MKNFLYILAFFFCNSVAAMENAAPNKLINNDLNNNNLNNNNLKVEKYFKENKIPGKNNNQNNNQNLEDINSYIYFELLKNIVKDKPSVNLNNFNKQNNINTESSSLDTISQCQNNKNINKAVDKYSLVKIIVKNIGSQANISSGSGGVISFDKSNGDVSIFTNFHVISDNILRPKATSLVVLFGGEEIHEYQAQIENVDAVNDLAILKVNFSQYKDPQAPVITPLIINENPLFIGEKLNSYGFPYGWNLVGTDGKTNGLLEKRKVSRYIISYLLTPGMSGGPTLNGCGELVGINVEGSASLALLIPVSVLKILLDKTKLTSINLNKLNINDRYIYLNKLIRLDTKNFTNELLDDILFSSESREIGGFLLPTKSILWNCWNENEISLGHNKKIDEKELEKRDANSHIFETEASCHSTDDIEISDSLIFGKFSLNYTSIQNRTAPKFIFNQIANYRYSKKSISLTREASRYTNKKNKHICNTINIQNRTNGVDNIFYCITEQDDDLYGLYILTGVNNYNSFLIASFSGLGFDETQIKKILLFFSKYKFKIKKL